MTFNELLIVALLIIIVLLIALLFYGEKTMIQSIHSTNSLLKMVNESEDNLVKLASDGHEIIADEEGVQIHDPECNLCASLS